MAGPGNEIECELLTWTHPEQRQYAGAAPHSTSGSFTATTFSGVPDAVAAGGSSSGGSSRSGSNEPLRWARVVWRRGTVPIWWGVNLQSLAQVVNFDWHGNMGRLSEEKAVEGFWSLMEPFVKQTGFATGWMEADEGVGQPRGGSAVQPSAPATAWPPCWRMRWQAQQSGVLRFNCADSLDRTNAATCFAMLPVLQEQLRVLGFELECATPPAAAALLRSRQRSSAGDIAGLAAANDTLEAAASGLPEGWEVRQHEGRLLYIDHINKTTQWAPPSPQQRPGSAGTGAAGGGGGSRPGSGAPLSARMMQSASDMLARLQQRSTSSTSPSRATPLERLERRSSPPRVASPEGHYWSRTGSSNSLNSVPHAASAPDVTLGGSRPSTAPEAPPSPALALAVGPQQPEQDPRRPWAFFDYDINDVRDRLYRDAVSEYVEIFRVHGDIHSFLYTGSPAMHSHVLSLVVQGGKGYGATSGVGKLQNLRVAVQRRWNNTVSDTSRQQAMELFLGLRIHDSPEQKGYFPGLQLGYTDSAHAQLGGVEAFEAQPLPPPSSAAHSRTPSSVTAWGPLGAGVDTLAASVAARLPQLEEHAAAGGGTDVERCDDDDDRAHAVPGVAAAVHDGVLGVRQSLLDLEPFPDDELPPAERHLHAQPPLAQQEQQHGVDSWGGDLEAELAAAAAPPAAFDPLGAVPHPEASPPSSQQQEEQQQQHPEQHTALRGDQLFSLDASGAAQPAAPSSGSGMSEAGPGAAAPSGEDSGGGALAPAAQERLQLAADVVDAAYAGLRPFYSNLLDDMGATDSFLICGHSLLLELLAGERLDWSHGGQFLQLRAALERFIAGINAANTTGLRYWVVLFDASAAVLPGAAAQAALALAASWLPALGVPTLRFSAWWGEDWRQWLERVRPSMLLLTDLPQGDPSGGAAAAASSAAQLQRARLFLQAAVVANQAQGVQCAFMSELRFMAEGHLFGFRTGWRSWVPSRRGTADRNALSAAAARDVGLAFERSAAEADGGSEGGALDAAALAQEIVGSAPPGRVRAALGAACCGLVAAQAAADGVPPTACQLYAQAWCLHELLLRRLSLQERALRLPEEPAGEAGGADGHSWQEVQRGLHTFLSAFHATAVAVLHSSSGSGSGATAAGGLACDGAGGSASGGASLALDASMADWVDGRLLHCVVQALWQGRPVGPLSPEEHVELQALLQQAAQHAASAGFAGGDSWAAALRQDAAPGKAGDVQHLLQQLLQPVPPQHVGSPAAEAGAPERRVLQENALVQAVVGSGGGVSAGLLLGLGAEEAGEYVEGSKAYDASFHWHSGKPIDATQMDVAAEELEVKQDLQAMTLEEVAACDALPPWVRRRAKFALEKIEFLLKGGFRNDAAKREKEAKKDLIQKVGATNRAWQTYYRHLEQYAKSLDATRFHHQPAGGKAGGGKGGGGGKGHAGQKQAGGVKKADLLRQKAAAERAAKAGDSAEEQWKLVRKGLEDR
ncbi:putative phosphoinositide phosphatase SAC9 [Micractinium conductrix]|uniref:Phosphoinositide phosphatase SAC9 n=1 Tax=Micractinium conductrix TaxID=554055 RepID=A0A2P6UZ78_9CHLO|nr:putative phosphoinositide phosphatase SAC9 [Micractinium conductrix]|eukprot:PSC67145.1 putative phosphoinositide phosphatase SAC9 [Micractinium conductrix]